MTFTLVALTHSSHHDSPAAAPAASFKPALRQGEPDKSPRFDAEPFVYRDPQTLLAANVAFRCLH